MKRLWVLATLLILGCMCLWFHQSKTVVTFTALGEYGRLGNQLFQIAAVRHVSQVLGATCVLPTRTKTLPLYSLFDLSGYDFADPSPTSFLQEIGPTTYQLPPTKERGVIDLKGYFQNLKYFSLPPLRPDMKRLGETYGSYVGVHVRRGDYVGQEDLFQVQTPDYYRKALAMIPTPTSKHKTQVIVCSDDIEWCKNNLNFDSATYDVEFSPDGSPETDDFAILAGCRALVMSASSFSWWAAQYGNKTRVIMPWPWFTPTGDLGKWNDMSALKHPQWTILNT